MMEDTDSHVILMLEMDALPGAGVVDGLRGALTGERGKAKGGEAATEEGKGEREKAKGEEAATEEGKGERGKAKGEEAEKETERLLKGGLSHQNDGERESGGVSGAVVRVGNQTRHLWGEMYSTVSVEGRVFRVSPGSFFQANTGLLPILLQQALSAVKADRIDTGVELYAGVGLFSIMFSERVRRLVVIEWNRDAVEDAGVNLHTNQIKNVEVIAKSVEDALDSLLSMDAKPEFVVMDPPREGLSNAVRSKIVQMSPEQVVYISCDPATLARDIKFLMASGEYVLERVQPLDMFPHTSHIECICSLARVG
ncbi:methyltransferase [Candidatus Poribacteria bacterium]|nr:methyltransferase [Candidatus Poribacteria bacterium]